MKKPQILVLAIGLTMIAACSESQSTDEQESQKKTGQITLQTMISQGATFCSEMRSMQKVQVLERINNPYVQIPSDCEIAAQPIPVQIKGEDPLGFVMVFNEGGRALVQRKDLETIQIRN